MNKLLVGLLLSVGIGSASAANWVAQGGTNGTIVASYVDTSSLIWTDYSYSTRSAWVKTYNKNGSSEMSRFFVHCPTRMQAITETRFYDGSGQFITNTVYNTGWDYAVPNTIGEKWAQTICTTPATTR